MKTITIDDNPAILTLMEHIMKNIDPDGEHYFAQTAVEGMELIADKGIRIVFLDIEMPGITGDEAAGYLIERYGRIDIIFITGHTEYALMGHQLHCTAFVTKPFGERDIAEALEYLRVPINTEKPIKMRCSGHFAVFYNGEPVIFERGRTAELLAYLVYKNGAIATNGELIGVLWYGDPDKQNLLRKHVKDLRDRFEEIDAEDVLIKKRGSIGINMKKITVEGDTSAIVQQFGWIL